MEHIFQSVLLLSCVGGILSGALLLLAPRTRRAFGARWQYGVWLCVLAVMVLPVRFDLPVRANPAPQSPGQALVQEAAAPADAAQPPAPAAHQARGQPAQGPHPLDVTPPIRVLSAWIWLLGALLSFGAGTIQYLRFLHIMRRHSHPIVCPALDGVKAELNLRRTVRIRSADCITAPLAAGLFRPVLLLPDRAMDAGALRHVLAHELTHIKRRDLLCKWFALLVRSVHWFNPLVHLVCRQMDEDCEISCDLAVTGSMDGAERRGYMRTILSLARPAPGPALRVTTSMAGERRQLERRFIMIQNTKKMSRPAALLSVLVVLSLLSTSVLASGVAAGALAGETGEKTAIEVYNDTDRLRFTNEPFIQNYEVYLPLRETLNGFGITDIRWEDGRIDIAFPPVDDCQGFAEPESGCRLAIGDVKVRFPSDENRVHYRNGVIDTDPDAGGYPLRFPPVVRDGVTYATVEFFEELIGVGQMPQFRVRLLQSTDPADYYTQGEEVFIGTSAQQDAYRPVDESGNPRYVKRIVTNERGEAVYVVLAEFQKPEVVAALPAVNSASMEGFTEVSQRTFLYNAYGESVLLSSGIFVYERVGENDFADIAYIPPALQINCHAYSEPT